MFGLFQKHQPQPTAPQELTIDLTGHGDTFADITSEADVQRAVSEGRIEPFPLIGEMFGGEPGPGNMIYGPRGAAAAKAAIDDEIVAAIQRGGQVGLGADLDYGDGDTRIPRAVVFELGEIGTRTLRFW